MEELKVNIYAVLSDCVEKGVEHGYNRAFKHTDTPDKEKVLAEIYTYVMLNISEYFKFEN